MPSALPYQTEPPFTHGQPPVTGVLLCVTIIGLPLGAGYLWSILSPPVVVNYVPNARSQAEPMFSVMLQLAGTIKDIVTRYFVMRGFDVERRFGWDCHGLPVESLIGTARVA